MDDYVQFKKKKTYLENNKHDEATSKPLHKPLSRL